MGESLEDARAKAEVSVGLVRQLVNSWLPKPSKSERDPISLQSIPSTVMYAADPVAAREQAQLKRKLVGKQSEQSSADGGASTTESRILGKGKGKGVVGSSNSKSSGKSDRRESIDEDEAVLHRISSSSHTIKKKPNNDVLSAYLNKSGGKKKKKKKKQGKQTVTEEE